MTKVDSEKITIFLPKTMAKKLRYLRGEGEIRSTAELIRGLLIKHLEERKEKKS